MVDTMVFPEAARFFKIATQECAVNVSSPLVGSSRKRIAGLLDLNALKHIKSVIYVIISIAMAQRFRSPPEIPFFESSPIIVF